MRVVWQATASGPGLGNYQTRDVPVPPYNGETVGLIAVHFLPNDQINVLVTNLYYEHSDYPIKDPR